MAAASFVEGKAAAIIAAAAAAAPAPVKLSYGTAGFRAEHSLLDSVFIRMGMLAALRALHLNSAVGVMITASHNPIEDNGVKMIDADGGMLAKEWEKYASALAAVSNEEVPAFLVNVAKEQGITLPASASSPWTSFNPVEIGYDTRPSSRRLADRVISGVQALGAHFTDRGLLTTPQLHHIVRMANKAAEGNAEAEKYSLLAGYNRMLADAFRDITAGACSAEQLSARGPLHLDCAHGVGAASAASLAEAMKGLVAVQLRNTGSTPEELAQLNEGVGAEHCQKERKPPAGFSAEADKGLRCASLDGDADRLVYWYFAEEDGKWQLLDGDKIACLAAAFLAEQLQQLGVTVSKEPNHLEEHHLTPAVRGGGEAAGGAGAGAGASTGHAALAGLLDAPVSVGIVQTAYANGASTSYILNSLHLPVRMAKTGVKFVHHEASLFDCGIYFEANGHGTVLFHPDFLKRLQAFEPASETQAQAKRRLLAASWLINQAIGDALSDALFVEAVLALKGWTVQQWNGIYSDLPSRQSKLPVKDRAAFVPNDSETRLLQPAELQEAIDALVGQAKYEGKGRAFVRPSGTENVVRTYAEAGSEELAAELGAAVVAAVKAQMEKSG